MKKITKKINFFFYFIFILTIFFINLYCNFLLKDNFTFKEWYFSGQDEIIFIYNALIINAGHVQEYLDHSSFFLILTFTIINKIISIFLPGFVFDINHFNSSGDPSLNLNTLFTIARIICFLFSIFLSIVTYHLVETITKNKLTSFLITLIFIFSSGVIINTNIIDSVMLSVIFLLTSSLFLVLFLKKKEGGIFLLFLFFFFFFASILQKIQSFLYLIPIFLSFLSLATKKNNLELNYLNIQYNKKNYLRIIFIVSIIIILKPVLIYKSIPSAIFYLLSYYLLNLIFFYYTKKYQKNIFKNLFLFNLIIIFSYLTLKTIVTFYPGTNLEIYNIPFGRIIFKLTRYVDSENYKELYESINISTLIFLKNYFIVFISNIKIVLANNFLKFNSNSIILYSCLLLFFFKFFYLNFKEKINLFFLIFFFFYSEIINTLRPQPHYAIYSLIFLIFFIAVITQFFYKKFIIYLFLFLILSLNIVASTKTIYKVKKSINVDQCLFLENHKEYYTYWTPKINFLILGKSCIFK